MCSLVSLCAAQLNSSPPCSWLSSITVKIAESFLFFNQAQRHTAVRTHTWNMHMHSHASRPTDAFLRSQRSARSDLFRRPTLPSSDWLCNFFMRSCVLILFINYYVEKNHADMSMSSDQSTQFCFFFFFTWIKGTINTYTSCLEKFRFSFIYRYTDLLL